MDWSVSPKNENWFLRVCHHIEKAVYLLLSRYPDYLFSCALKFKVIIKLYGIII